MSYTCLNYPKFIFSHNKKIIADNKQQYSQKRLKRDISKPLKTVDSKFSLKKPPGCEECTSTSNVLFNELQTATHSNALGHLGAYQEKTILQTEYFLQKL